MRDRFRASFPTTFRYAAAAAVAALAAVTLSRPAASATPEVAAAANGTLCYQPRRPVDTGGYGAAEWNMQPWKQDATLQEISDAWQLTGFRSIAKLDPRRRTAPRRRA